MFHTFSHLARGVFPLMLFLVARAGWAEEFYGRVVQVDAGDRLEVKHKGHLEHVRLYNVYCPPGSWGDRAKRFTIEIAGSRGVRVHMLGTDLHGSAWVDVIFLGGHTLSEELVQYGFARMNSDAPSNKKLIELEEQARRLRRGIWSDVLDYPQDPRADARPTPNLTPNN